MNTDNVCGHGALTKIANHDGLLVSYSIESQKQKIKNKTIYDYKNADINGLTNFIKHFDFESAMFIHPTLVQAELYTEVLTDSFEQFIPCKTVAIRPNDPPWSNTYTRLLLRKNNRNYQFYKKVNNVYTNLLNQTNASPEILTKYLNKKNKAYKPANLLGLLPLQLLPPL